MSRPHKVQINCDQLASAIALFFVLGSLTPGYIVLVQALLISDNLMSLAEPDPMESCYERDARYIGYDLSPSAAKAQTAKSCGDLCYENGNCYWWSWNSADKVAAVDKSY